MINILTIGPFCISFLGEKYEKYFYLKSLGNSTKIFTNSAPLGRVGHRVAMSVCLCV